MAIVDWGEQLLGDMSYWSALPLATYFSESYSHDVAGELGAGIHKEGRIGTSLLSFCGRVCPWMLAGCLGSGGMAVGGGFVGEPFIL